MSTRDLLLEEIEQTPEEVLGEVLDFVRFLRSKGLYERRATALASEAVLQRDWERPEEDEAWRDL